MICRVLRAVWRVLCAPLPEEAAEVVPQEGTLEYLDYTLQNLWDERRRIDAANEALVDALATRQREFLRVLSPERLVPPSDEVMRENHRRSTA